MKYLTMKEAALLLGKSPNGLKYAIDQRKVFRDKYCIYGPPGTCNITPLLISEEGIDILKMTIYAGKQYKPHLFHS